MSVVLCREKKTEQVNEHVRQVLMTVGKKRSAARGSYADHTPSIGKYATENGPARATRHFSVPGMMARSVLGKSAKFNNCQ